MPTKVIYYQGTTETFLPPAVPRGALETVEAPRAKRKPVRGEDAQLVIPAAAIPTGWDAADPLPRRRKLQRTDDSGLTLPTFAVPSGWDISDPRPFKRTAKQRDEAQSIIPSLSIPTGWEVQQRQRPVMRRRVPAEDALAFSAFVLDTVGWFQDSPTIGRRRKRFFCDDDILFPVSPPVVYDAEPIVSCGALAHLADYRANKSLADCVSELQIGSFAVIAGLSDRSADSCLANAVSRG